MIFNSLRFEETEHLMKKDEVMSKLIGRAPQYKVEEYLFQTSDYCFVLLTRHIVMKISKDMCRQGPGRHNERLYKIFDDIINMQFKFLDELESYHGRTESNKPNPAINSEDYIKYLRAVKNNFKDYGDDEPGQCFRTFWILILSCILKSENVNCLLYTSPSPRD